MTPDAIRERIARESARNGISSNTALILREMLDLIEAVKTPAEQPCAECARRAEWATGAKC